MTIDVEITAENSLPMISIDFTIVTESGGEYDADPRITDRGDQLSAG